MSEKKTRQAIEGGGWFCTDTATRYAEDTWWDGHNHISKATGSQWDHEELYRTKGGIWIINRWSNMQGLAEQWYKITDLEAAEWLIKNNEELPDDLLGAADKMELK